MSEYLFTNRPESVETERLRLLELTFDPFSFALLQRLGLAKGDQILEIGPGTGGLLPLFSSVVGGEGKVTAIDLNTQFLQKLPLPNLEVIQANILDYAFKEPAYDFIHARYVFMHIAEAQSALANALRALKPGGWIFLEEADFGLSEPSMPQSENGQSFIAVKKAIAALFASKNLRPDFGRSLPLLFQSQKIDNINTALQASLSPGGSAMARIMHLSLLQLSSDYLRTQTITQSDLDHYSQMTEDPNQWAVYYATVSAWGQKPDLTNKLH